MKPRYLFTCLVFLIFSGVQKLWAQPCPRVNPVVVTSAGITGQSLPWAVGCLNSVPQLTLIEFDIPGAGPHIIQPSPAFGIPPITKSNSTIDGRTQPIGEIVIDGSLANLNANGLTLEASGVSVYGLEIRNFQGTPSNNQSGAGIFMQTGANHLIDGNTIIQNKNGIHAFGGVNSFTAQSNLLGSNAGSGNQFAGILIEGSTTSAAILDNEIGHQGALGIFAPGIGNVLITGNSIYCNPDAGIIHPSGPAPPEITEATVTHINGLGTPGALIEIFLNNNTGCGAGIPCQGRSFLGTTTVPASGIWTFNPAGQVVVGNEVTATATTAGNNTSEFAPCATVANLCATFDVTSNALDVSCAGGSDGQVTANATGGTSPYFFEWNTGDIGPNLINIPAGTYTVTGTDINGCTESVTVTVEEPPAITSSLIKTDVSCFGGTNGSATATVRGGVAPYSLLWSNGARTNAINNLPAGIYRLTITDQNSCTSVDSVTILQPTSINSAISKTDVRCFGGTDGAATANVTGGTAPYSLLWSNGARTNAINNLPAGIYRLTITDQNSCTSVDSVTILQPAAINSAISKTDVRCFGGTDGAATANVTGGTAPYSLLWSNGARTNAINNLPAGIYRLTITDQNSCTRVDSVTILQPTAINSAISKTDVRCFGGTDGAATANVTGGTAPYSILWSNGARTNAINNLPAGIYRLTITDQNSCTRVDSVTILQPAAINSAISKTDVRCFGGTDGAATANVTGGTAPYSLLWSNGARTNTINNLPAGIYRLTITDQNSCTRVDSVTILQPGQITIVINKTDETTAGANDGTASAVVTGGTPAYQYNWSNGMTGVAISNLSPGNYQLIVTDRNGCRDSARITIAAATGCTLDLVLSKTDLQCYQDGTGSAVAAPLGGTAPYRYNWSNGAGTPAIGNLAAGVYIITLEDADNCTTIDSVTITEPPALSMSIVKTDETSAGANDGTATATGFGGTPPYGYLWSNGQMTSGIINLSPGTYQVTVTDTNACRAIQAITIRGSGGNCQTEAGTMDITLIQVCQYDTAKAKHLGDEILESDDVLEFILHDEAGEDVGNIFARNSRPEFTFLPGMIAGRRYYISAIAGNADAGNQVDLGDICLSVAAGAPVIFQRQPVPVYALQAPDTVCGNEPFLLEVDDLYPSLDVRYKWLLPTGEQFDTQDPTLRVNATSIAYSGGYIARRDSATCLSQWSSPVEVAVVSLPAGSASAGRDTILCGENAFQLNAQSPVVGSGRWSSLQFATFSSANTPGTMVSNLQPGDNIFIWSVGIGNCPNALKDTVVVRVQQAPVLSDDEYTLYRASDLIAMHVLLNDRLSGLSDTTVLQLSTPEVGLLEFLPDKKSFRFSVDEEQRGTVQFLYAVCDELNPCNYDCDTALVTIHILALPKVPEGLTINGDGLNETLQIRGLKGFSRVEILIANRWGDVVYEEKQYDNASPWRGNFQKSGKPLPGGAYYYVLKAYENDNLVGDPQTGVIHIFR